MKKILIVIGCALIAAPASADQWKILGTRPMGMGGAFVAVAQGPIAQYWNPGGLAMASSKTVSGMEIPVTAGIEMTGDIMQNASDIGDMTTQLKAVKDAQALGTAITPSQAADFIKTMGLLNAMNDDGKGAMVELAGGANFKFSKVAISVNNFTTVGLNPYIDTYNLNLSAVGTKPGLGLTGGATGLGVTYTTAISALTSALDQLGAGNAAFNLLCGGSACAGDITNNATLANALATYATSPDQVLQAAAVISANAANAAPVVAGALTGGSYDLNTSNLTIDAASFTEIAFGYGKFMKFLDGLSIGGNVKMINGRMAQSTFLFMQNDKTKDAFKNMMEDSKSSWAPGLDLGALWDVNKKYPGLPLNPKVGLVIRNLNSPAFKRPDLVGGKYTLDRQARIGFAIQPAKFWNVAMDLDVTKNKTAVDGFDSRQLAFGTEINVVNKKYFNIPLRAGLMKNLAEKSSKMAYTLGTGVNLLYMHFDVGAAISSDRTNIDDKKIPTKATVSASFGLLF
jgi:hypothetical protein